jgi:hypothetical protein
MVNKLPEEAVVYEGNINAHKEPSDNVRLQQKKNKVRALIAEMGFQKKGATNTYDKYDYFSEAQYKELIVGLFAKCGIEFYTTVNAIEEIQGTSGMPFGRRATLLIVIVDIDTGFGESSTWIGEAYDKTDKALYKAYTGAFKYYVANTFHVPTGDDPEADKTPAGTKPADPEFILPWHIKVIKSAYNTSELMERLLTKYKLKRIEDMPYTEALTLVEDLNARAKAKKSDGEDNSQS